MLGINLEDVMNVLNSCKPHLIGLGIALALAAAVLIAAAVLKGLSKPVRYLVRTQAAIAALLAVIVTANLVMTGPLSALLDLTSGGGSISEASIEEANAFGVKVAEEGIVLLKNEAGTLPLDGGTKLNVFGWASTNPCYGGSGSGGISDSYPKISILQGLEDAGFQTNHELSDFYAAYCGERPSVDMFTQDWTLPEPPTDQYSDSLLKGAEDFSDTALIVFARTGCENADLPMDLTKVTYNDNSSDYLDFGADRHYLELSRSEEQLVELVCSRFDNVIVVYNGSSAFELGFVERFEQIKGLIWCSGAGQTGFAALGEILSGKVNPSGKTTDILVRDLTAAPCYNNFMITNYDNMDEHAVEGPDFAAGGTVTKRPSFVNYVEGIYVGYKFYETADVEGFLNYDEAVQYPFGYGLSYTSFTQEMGDLSEKDGQISFDVTVMNTGAAAGKDVVEVYFEPPYTNGGIEKSAVNLAAYAKTGLLEPGKSETLTLSFSMEDMASYDEGLKVSGGGYILEAGSYAVSIRSDSHTVLDQRDYQVEQDVVFDASNPRSTDDAAAVNRFQFARGEVTYLSRADGFVNFSQATAAPVSRSMSAEGKAAYLDLTNYDPADYNDEADVMPVTGANNGVKLAELRGLSYEDAKWDSLLDQLTVDDMRELIALGGYQTIAIDRIGKLATMDCDGPVDIYSNFTGETSIGLPSVVMLASTWNQNLGREYGACLAKMADEMGVSGWYAPSMNMHRSAFAGRNFEYYSEDSVLSGYMAASVVGGAREYGVYPYIKHFAMNDQETDRWYKNSVWSNEQAIREVYLKPFELAVKQGGTDAVMSSYNYIGPVWDGACSALLQDVLRGEWGFRGMVITDFFLSAGGAMNADQAIRNGSDLMLLNYDGETNYVTDCESATGVIAMRTAAHNILYTVVNSRAYATERTSSMATWKVILLTVDVILAVAVILLEVMAVRHGYQKRKSEEPQNRA